MKNILLCWHFNYAHSYFWLLFRHIDIYPLHRSIFLWKCNVCINMQMTRMYIYFETEAVQEILDLVVSFLSLLLCWCYTFEFIGDSFAEWKVWHFWGKILKMGIEAIAFLTVSHVLRQWRGYFWVVAVEIAEFVENTQHFFRACRRFFPIMVSIWQKSAIKKTIWYEAI